MPVEIEVDGEPQTVPMTDGRATITVPADALILIDPQNKLLRQLDFIDQSQESMREQRQAAAAQRAARSAS